MPSALQIVAQPELYSSSHQACACLGSLGTTVAHVPGGCTQRAVSLVLSAATRSGCKFPLALRRPGKHNVPRYRLQLFFMHLVSVRYPQRHANPTLMHTDNVLDLTMSTTFCSVLILTFLSPSWDLSAQALLKGMDLNSLNLSLGDTFSYLQSFLQLISEMPPVSQHPSYVCCWYWLDWWKS